MLFTFFSSPLYLIFPSLFPHIFFVVFVPDGLVRFAATTYNRNENITISLIWTTRFCFLYARIYLISFTPFHQNGWNLFCCFHAFALEITIELKQKAKNYDGLFLLCGCCDAVLLIEAIIFIMLGRNLLIAQIKAEVHICRKSQRKLSPFFIKIYYCSIMNNCIQSNPCSIAAILLFY